MTALQNFAFDDMLVRVIMRDGEPWFVLADVCRVLDIKNSRDVSARLDADEKDRHTMTTLGGQQDVSIINESGLYSLILTSRKEEAKRFKKWVTSDVLPSIRKTGSYGLPRPESRMDIGDENLAAWRLKLDTVKEARILHGAGVAKRLWRALGFPDPMAPLGDALAGDGAACLNHLLAHRLQDGRTVFRHVREALANDDVRNRPLMDIGLRVVLSPDPGLSIVRAANLLRPVFGGTEWADGRHGAALRSIPGVGAGKNMKFGRETAWSIFIPVEALPAPGGDE